MPNEEVLHTLDLLGVQINWLVPSAAFFFDYCVTLQSSWRSCLIWAGTNNLFFSKLSPLSEALQFEMVIFINDLALLLHVSEGCSPIWQRGESSLFASREICHTYEWKLLHCIIREFGQGLGIEGKIFWTSGRWLGSVLPKLVIDLLLKSAEAQILVTCVGSHLSLTTALNINSSLRGQNRGHILRFRLVDR